MNVIPRQYSRDSSSESDILNCEVSVSEFRRPTATNVVWCGKYLLGCRPWHMRRYSILVPLSTPSAKCLSVISLQEKRDVTATYDTKCTTNGIWSKFSKYIVTCALFTAPKRRSVKTKTHKLIARIWPSKRQSKAFPETSFWSENP